MAEKEGNKDKREFQKLKEENQELKKKIELMKETIGLRKALGKTEKSAQSTGEQLTSSGSAEVLWYPTSNSQVLSHSENSLHRNLSQPSEIKELKEHSTLEELFASLFTVVPPSFRQATPGIGSGAQHGDQPAILCGELKSPELHLNRSLDNVSNCPLEKKTEKQTEEEEKQRLKSVWSSGITLTGRNNMEGDKTQGFYANELKPFPNMEQNCRFVGEIAFQLDRRILAHIFPQTKRLYGFTVSNIPEKIKQVCTYPIARTLDEQRYREMSQRYISLMHLLGKLGYQRDVHPVFSEFLINTYGILKQQPEADMMDVVSDNPAALRRLVIDTVPAKFLRDTLLLLNCLCELSRMDSKALFTW
nr:PREDICTED: speriolin-like protein isoform X2 [Latimeria chalumnae]|eukprot:XP_014344928.1 PREDICTED: speriolin-like protein isoform X2 [Latimeria chalumnae]